MQKEEGTDGSTLRKKSGGRTGRDREVLRPSSKLERDPDMYVKYIKPDLNNYCQRVQW